MRYGPYKRTDTPGAYPDGMPVALEYDGDEYPAQVGMIMAYFAAIERELPGVIARVTGMKDPNDAIAICAEFRSFSARLGILEAVLKLRDEMSHDRIIYTHCRTLFKEANHIRNKYGHALYAKGQTMRISTFHNDHKPPSAWIDAPLVYFKKDRKRMSVILAELFAILYQKELPPALFDKLRSQDTQ